MILLAVETSAAVASAAIARDGALILELSADTDQKHAQTVLPLVQELLKKTGLTLADIDAFAVDIGPGSFTGVRIGVCAVNAMAFALHKPVIGVDSLATLAEPYREAGVCVRAMIDAGHGASYCAQYEGGVCTLAPDARDTEEFLASLPKDAIVVRDVMPAAGQVALAAWHTRSNAASAAVPLYVQPSQAERLFEQRRRERA